MLGSLPVEAKGVVTMPVRGCIPILFWLCAIVLSHFGFAFAGTSSSTLQETPVPIVTPAPAETSQPQAGLVGNRAQTHSIGTPAIPELARETLEALEARHGDPLPGYVGGRTFQNREHTLPRGRYREYDVHPKTPGKHRGAERIVIDQRTGKAYYTADHYHSFTPMN